MPPVALVTGASRGIGKAAALKLASRGYHTYITCSRSEKDLLSVKEDIETACRVPCAARMCDMGDFAAVERLFCEFPALDVLVNNAGISYTGLLQDMAPEDWRRVLDTNLTSCFNTCRLAIPLMLRQGRGKIVNVSSVFGSSGASMEVAYSASKGGVNAFTKALARELAPCNIQVNALACGVIDTVMNGQLSKEERDALKEEIPAGRFGTAKEAAEAIWMLASAPGYLTGQVVALDGGWL